MKTLRILSWNVNGLRAVWKKGFPEWLERERPDILCLQETKAWPDQLEREISCMTGYECHFDWGERKGYSGVAILTREKPLTVTRGFGVPEFDREGRTLVAEYPGFTLFSVYFPNGKASQERLDFKMAFYESFLTHTDALRRAGRPIVVCGDVNTAHHPIDLARPRENEKISGFLPQEREWMDRYEACGFVDTLRLFDASPGRYTWWDMKSGARQRNVGWRIDYFFVSENLRGNVKNAFILPEVMGSDHCPIGIELATG